VEATVKLATVVVAEAMHHHHVVALVQWMKKHEEGSLQKVEEHLMVVVEPEMETSIDHKSSNVRYTGWRFFAGLLFHTHEKNYVGINRK